MDGREVREHLCCCRPKHNRLTNPTIVLSQTRCPTVPSTVCSCPFCFELALLSAHISKRRCFLSTLIVCGRFDDIMALCGLVYHSAIFMNPCTHS